ncbi:hypothetical protein, partial [Streptomyces sp. NPDC004976]
ASEVCAGSPTRVIERVGLRRISSRHAIGESSPPAYRPPAVLLTRRRERRPPAAARGADAGRTPCDRPGAFEADRHTQ